VLAIIQQAIPIEVSLRQMVETRFPPFAHLDSITLFDDA